MHMTRRKLLISSLLAGGTAVGCASSGTGPDPGTPQGQFIDVDGTRLHYRTMGKGPNAVLIHGASGNMRDWTVGPADALARKNTLLLFDRPGQGFSDPAPKDGSDPFVQARLMRTAAERLGFGQAHLVGHSYGGSVALAWALDAPETVTGMQLISAPSQVWEGGVGVLYDIAANPVTGPIFAGLAPSVIGDSTVENAIERIFAPQSAPPGYAEQINARLVLRPQALRSNARDLTQLKGHIRQMVPRYPELRMPVELVHGTADEVVGATIHTDLLARQLPQARYSRLPGIGHMPHHVATAQVTAAMERLNARL